MTTSQDWFVYIVEAENGTLYTGISTDPVRRLKEHRNGSGARFFHTSRPDRIVFQETQPDRGSASRREAAIKKLSRRAKLDLIARQ